MLLCFNPLHPCIGASVGELTVCPLRLLGACMQELDLLVYERYVPMKATRAMHSQVHAIPCQRSEALRAAEFFVVCCESYLICCFNELKCQPS